MTASEWIGGTLIPTLTAAQYLGLALVTAIIAGALSLEHYAVGRRAWPKRHYYAIGLVTVMGPLLLWAGIQRLQLNVGTGLLLVVAGCLSGAPDWLLLQRRERRLAIAWKGMMERNRQLGTDLARARLVADYRNAERIDGMVEGLGFALGCMRSDLNDMQTITRHLEPLLVRFLDICEDGVDEL
jgi:hypothetical protein